MSIAYAIEKFGGAVHVLTTSPADLRARLFSAYMGFYPVEANRDLPEELRADYEWLRAALDRFPAELPGEGTVQATLRRISEQEAVEIAERIFKIYTELVKPWEHVADPIHEDSAG